MATSYQDWMGNPATSGLQMLDEFGNPIQVPQVDPSQTGLTNPIETAAPTGDATTPAPSDTTDTGTTDTGAGFAARHGGIKDPATGEQTVGQPTGPAPGTGTTTPNDPYGGLDKIIQDILAQQAAERAQTQQQRASLDETLNRVIGEAQRPVSSQDPQIAGPTGAFWAQGQRARALLQEQLAQQAAATGQTTGSVESGIKSSYEDLGNETGSYQGGLMRDELNNRRSELLSALQMATQFGTASDVNRIQEQLGLINAKLTAQGQKNQLGSQANSLDEILAALLASQAA
jgi:hypothetical protein